MSRPKYYVEKVHSPIQKHWDNDFKKLYPQYKNKTPGELRKMIVAINEEIANVVSETRDGVEFPESLGYMFVGTCNRPKNNPDYNKYYKEKIKVQHRNFESDNYLAKIFYTNFANKYGFKYRELWKFRASKDFSHKVSVTYPLKWTIFVKVDNFIKISDMFNRAMNTIYYLAKKKNNSATEEYNEFEMI